jgi:asparagine synthase (glutamine-hydrolysing)
MCSILGILDIKTDAAALRELALKLSRRQRHRGPDWSGVYASDRAVLAHERLAIVDVDNGAQPLYNAERTHVLAVNGEIYNHLELESRLSEPYEFQTRSDCEIILALYSEKCSAEKGTSALGELLNDLNGIFAFVLYDEERDRYLVARDPIGVMPLFIGHDEHGNLFVASEMKALVEHCRTIQDFPPGHYLLSDDDEVTPYYKPAWREYEAVEGVRFDATKLRDALERAVERQLMCDVPYGVLISGGLDSSLTGAVARHYTKKRIEDDGQSEAWWPQLHSFAIGLEGSPDLAAARKVAAAIGTVHHEVVYTVQEGIDALPDVIRHIETFDVTTIRASTPMYLLARRIKAMGIKMVLTGEGADEIFGGYLYFHKAPNAREFHAETIRKLDALYKFDCLRANKSMAAWGIEARVPFLDRDFLDVAMGFDAADKMTDTSSGNTGSENRRMEKHTLRSAFEGFIPAEILWRQKEQFSDGVGYSWIDSLRALAEEKVRDDELERASYRFPRNTPLTKEAYLYRSIFESHFPGDAAAAVVPEGKSIACSSPAAIAWEASFADNADPSGRAIKGVHQDSY